MIRRTPWATLLWPGLPQLWLSGMWWGLLLAAAFAVLVSLLLVASFVWVELVRPLELRLGWLAVGSLWGGSAALSVGFARRGPESSASSTEALFREALNEYLRGNWFEAESQLIRMLRRYPRDVEARLLRATLLRRTNRFDEALDQLDRLERLADAARWGQEIANERQWNAEALAQAVHAEVGPPAAGQADQPSSRQAA